MKKGLAIGLIVIGLLGVVAAFATAGSVRGYLKDEFRAAGRDDGQLLYTSNQSVAKTAAKIAKAHEPADRRVTPEGVFLRYRKDFVAVTPQGSGSRIAVVDERRGYTAFYGYVGGYWGTYSGRGESFRGGGPGSGK